MYVCHLCPHHKKWASQNCPHAHLGPLGQSRFGETNGKTQNSVCNKDQGSSVAKVRHQSKVRTGSRSELFVKGQSWVLAYGLVRALSGWGCDLSASRGHTGPVTVQGFLGSASPLPPLICGLASEQTKHTGACQQVTQFARPWTSCWRKACLQPETRVLFGPEWLCWYIHR